MLKIASAAALLAMIAAPGLTQSEPQRVVSETAQPQSATGAQQKKSDLDRVVCEEQDTIGSRLGAKKVCMTVAQWQEYNQNQHEQTARIQQDANITSGH